MKQRILLLFALIFFTITGGLHLAAQGITVSGLLESSVSMQAGAGDSPDFSFGFEEYANLRFQSRIRDNAAVYGAVNLIAVTGNYAAAVEQMALYGQSPAGISLTSFIAGQNYIAAIELERLYFRLRGENTDFDGGLMRLPFGFGQVWKSSDFLNPGNPLKPDARPRAILGAAFFWYPTDESKFMTYYSAPREPFSGEGKGSFFGLSFDNHWNKASIQTMYSYETPNTGSDNGIHRAGLSFKADIEIGFYLDTLYTYNYDADTELDGLSFSAGFDYSFFDGNVIVLAEYLYNGESSSTALGSGGSFRNNHYLYTGLTFRFNDYTNMSTAVIFGFDDISFIPIITLNHDIFQGATLTISAQVPMDRDLFYGDGNRGELGPVPPDKFQPLLSLTGERLGRYFDISTKVRIRF
jgi:hypothetical protein